MNQAEKRHLWDLIKFVEEGKLSHKEFYKEIKTSFG